MSRIEEALEKAARMRGQGSVAVPPDRSDVAAHTPPQAAGEKLTVSNQLLVMANDPGTPAAEEYRKLKSGIVRLTRGEQFNNLLMVTSSVGSEGKSITALNLAMSLAHEYDHTVLLVEADLRKPSLQKYLGVDKQKGLADCLLDGVDVRDALVKTGIGRLSLLASGREVANPAEILSSQRAREFFLELKNRYHDRYVIIDTPPVLPFAETRSMCGFVDGVVLVVKEGGVSLEKISEALECLHGPSLLGIVYNQACREKLDASYYYYRQNAAADKKAGAEAQRAPLGDCSS